MTYVYVVPKWFFGTSIALEVLFALATFFVAFYSFRVARIYRDKAINLMTVGFVFVALSYLSKAAVNVFLLREITTGYLALSLSNLNSVASAGFYLYISFYLIGLILLTYMTFKSSNADLFLLITVLSFIGIWVSPDKVFAFSIISAVMLCIITLHFARSYERNKNGRTLLIFLGFLGLLLVGIGFTFAEGYYVNYVVGHLLELASYGLILASIFSLTKKRK